MLNFMTLEELLNDHAGINIILRRKMIAALDSDNAKGEILAFIEGAGDLITPEMHELLMIAFNKEF